MIELAIATHAMLKVVELDDRFRLRQLQVLATGHHYGIALDATGAPGFLAKHDDRVLTTFRRRPQDGVWAATSETPFQQRVGYVHQIARANGGLYITNTTYNSLVFQDDPGTVWHEFHFGDRSDEDIHHVNSVFPCGSLVLALLHNRNREPSQAILFSHQPRRGFERLATLGLAHYGCHNVFVDEHHLFYNASAAGKLVMIPKVSPANMRELTFPGHVKGMSVTDQHIFVGLSAHAPRDKRVASPGSVLVIDRPSLEHIATVDLNDDGPVGNINEIRCLSQTDHAHAGRETDLQGLHSFRLRRENKLQRYFRLFSKKLRLIAVRSNY
jgi:hypothetical protein